MPASNIVVFDSNVLITLIIPASLSTRLLERLDAAGWEVAASPQLLAEVAEKLRTKATLRRWANVSDQEIEEFLTETLLDLVSLVPGIQQAIGAVPADPKDDMIIAAALEVLPQERPVISSSIPAFTKRAIVLSPVGNATPMPVRVGNHYGSTVCEL